MPTCPRHLLVALMVLGTPAEIVAQGEGSFGRVRSGQQVRVRTSDGRLLEGRFTPDSVMATGEIDSVWARGNHAKTGAIVGAIVLGATGGGLGYLLCELGSDGHGCQDWEAVPLLGMAGAAAGAGIGALIGSAAPNWNLRYARPGIGLRLQPSLRRVGFSVTVPLAPLN